MTVVQIPEWNADGLLPVAEAHDALSAYRSPYEVGLVDFVNKFGTSADRLAILAGLLRYRAALHSTGMVSGFQWLDGSFVENIELIESRSPNDIDVVNFFEVPAGETQKIMAARNPFLYPKDVEGRKAVKEMYRVDGFNQGWTGKMKRLISASVFWYSLWSHRRDLSEKGFVQVDLSPAKDADALQALVALNGGVAP